MKVLIACILVLLPIYRTYAQKDVYLKNNEDGQLIQLKRKTVLLFKTSDSTSVTGRILSANDSSLEISTYRKNKESEIVHIPINSIQEITNKLMNDPPVVSGIFGILGMVGLITSPFLLITDTKEDALGLLETSAVFFGISAVFYTPHLIQKKFNTEEKWTLVTK